MRLSRAGGTSLRIFKGFILGVGFDQVAEGRLRTGSLSVAYCRCLLSHLLPGSKFIADARRSRTKALSDTAKMVRALKGELHCSRSSCAKARVAVLVTWRADYRNPQTTS
jgi:hypothetical protein